MYANVSYADVASRLMNSHILKFIPKRGLFEPRAKHPWRASPAANYVDYFSERRDIFPASRGNVQLFGSGAFNVTMSRSMFIHKHSKCL